MPALSSDVLGTTPILAPQKNESFKEEIKIRN
jgi:hypothetical protein